MDADTAAPVREDVCGFVLAGGRSSRMGQDKALLEVGGQPLALLALRRLQQVCLPTMFAGGAQSLAQWAEVVPDTWSGNGPSQGIEAALAWATAHSDREWCVFTPVDVPAVPVELLQRWLALVLDEGTGPVAGSCLLLHGLPQPAFCVLRKSMLQPWAELTQAGERRLGSLQQQASASIGLPWKSVEAAELGIAIDLASSFRNLNTPEDLKLAQQSLPSSR